MAGARDGSRERLRRRSTGERRRSVLIDRQAGKALTLTPWESEEAAAETDKFADQSRASTVEATGVELVDRGAYEVVMRL